MRREDREKPIGLDLVDMKPNFSKSFEENIEIFKKRYLKVYGEYPPILNELLRKRKNGDKTDKSSG